MGCLAVCCCVEEGLESDDFGQAYFEKLSEERKLAQSERHSACSRAVKQVTFIFKPGLSLRINNMIVCLNLNFSRTSYYLYFPTFIY